MERPHTPIAHLVCLILILSCAYLAVHVPALESGSRRLKRFQVACKSRDPLRILHAFKVLSDSDHVSLGMTYVELTETLGEPTQVRDRG